MGSWIDQERATRANNNFKIYFITIKSIAPTAALFALNRSVFSERFVKYRSRWPILKRLFNYLIDKSVWSCSVGAIGNLQCISQIGEEITLALLAESLQTLKKIITPYKTPSPV